MLQSPLDLGHRLDDFLLAVEDGVTVFLKDDLLDRMGELELLEPVPVSGCPVPDLLRLREPVPEQEGQETLLHITLEFLHVLPKTGKIPHGFGLWIVSGLQRPSQSNPRVTAWTGPSSYCLSHQVVDIPLVQNVQDDTVVRY